MNDLLKFDLYAMSNPKNTRDFTALIREAIEETRSINEKLDAILAPAPVVSEHA